MLGAKGLVKTFGDFKATDHVSFTIPDGKILGSIDQDGIEETTIFRLILNFLTQDSGSVLQDSQPLSEKEHDIIGYLPGERGLYPKTTIEDQLIYLASLWGKAKKEIEPKIDLWMEKFRVRSRKTDKAKPLSRDSQQKVQLIAIFVHEPRLAILDELFNGLDPVNAGLLKDDVTELKNQGSCATFPSRNVDSAEEIYNHLVMLENGCMVLNGQTRETRQRFGRIELFSESPLSVKEVAATVDAKEVHSRQDDVLEATLEDAEMGKMLFDKATANGCIPTFNRQSPILEEILRMKVGGQDE